MLYYVRRVWYNDNRIPIILQNTNGPCPLLALVNALLLRRALRLPDTIHQVSFDYLSELIRKHLRIVLTKKLETIHRTEAVVSPSSSSAQAGERPIDHQEAASLLQNHEDALRLMPKLEKGLDINARFYDVFGFEYTPATAMFDLYAVRLFHGWVYDPQDATVATALERLSYNEVVNLLTAEEETGDGGVRSGRPAVLGNSGEAKTVAAADRDGSGASRRRICRQFLTETQNQFTVAGLIRLHEVLAEGELAVLFRNNHFSTLLKRSGHLFTLVTDLGVISENRNIAWARIDDVHGDDTFVGDTFSKPCHAPAVHVPQLSSPAVEQKQPNNGMVPKPADGGTYVSMPPSASYAAVPPRGKSTAAKSSDLGTQLDTVGTEPRHAVVAAANATHNAHVPIYADMRNYDARDQARMRSQRESRSVNPRKKRGGCVIQ